MTGWWQTARRWVAGCGLCWGLLWGGSVGALPPPLLDFSPQETAWLSAHPVVRVGLSNDFPPYYLHDPQTGRPHGFVLEMMTLWSQRTGLQFEFERLPDFPAVLAALEAGRIDMTPFTVPLTALCTLVTVSVPPSRSLSLVTRDEAATTSDVSSAVLAVSFTATGLSLTGVTVTFTVAVALPPWPSLIV